MRARFEAVDLCALTADLASTFRSAMEQAGLDVHVDCAPLAEPVYVDRDMWEKIVLNLLSNAFKFTFAGQRHRLGRARDRPGACCRCATPASASRQHELPRVFERFHRVEGSQGAATRDRASASRWSRNW